MIAVERSDLSRCRAVTSRVPRVDPLALVHAFESGPMAVVESRSGELSVGVGEAFVIEARGPDRFESIRKQAGRVFASFGRTVPPLRMLGGFAFEETDARFVLPRWLYQTSAEGARLTLVLRGDEDSAKVELERERIMRTLEDPPALDPVPRALSASPDRDPQVQAEGAQRVKRAEAGDPASPDRDPQVQAEGAQRVKRAEAGDPASPDRDPQDYRRMVARAVSAIDAGEMEKVVLARRIRIEAADRYRIAPVLAALGRSEGSVRFAFGRSGEFFAGASPELLVAKHGAEARSEALAGSARPGLAGSLLDSPKERAEHGYVARFVSSTLEAFSREVEVATSELSLLPHVAHLRTPIRARLARPVHLLELAAALHPTPAVGGTPRKAACDFIAAVEGAPRGWYAGPVGWFDAEGDGELFVALRSARFDGARAELLVGAGIVSGSDPDQEAHETELKAKTIAGALGATP